MDKVKQSKVLVFDSGVGGLSVYKEIKQRLPHIDIVYFFDNEAYPYGELDPETLVTRVDSFITDIAQREQIDLVVIACNTASTIVLPSLRAKLSIPVVGVVPAIKPASAIANKAVGLIATPATVTRSYTHELIKHFSLNKKVELLGSTRLVDMAEEKLRGKPVDLYELSAILKPLQGIIDVAVLGCTHFPLIKDEISQVLGQQIVLVDSGEAIARRVAYLIGEGEGTIDKTKHQIIASAPLWEEDALNQHLSQLGFLPIQYYHHLDA
ncbi:glutamate racemase [Vibrio nitrifigilis]|uniref:Glutamate racemase n=1 Tax=Vibrio nitrifigilis TaxID=2789781 RepID=A0ABS0GI81_9VIBR|nr:glutamate racemase [Vibrio nitrifigilis]MBF9001898.1 glutamate racemase [Vibrio nitrifigilis]